MLIAIRRWFENPIAPDDPDAARILNVSQPSAADIVAEIEDCDNEILSFQDSNFVKTKAAMLKDRESVPGPEKREYKLVQAMIKHREDMRDSLKRLLKFDNRIGIVFAGSGFLRSKKVPMWNEETIRDWALVEVDPERETHLTHVSQLQFFLATSLHPLQLSLTLPSLPRLFFNHLTTRIRSLHMEISPMRRSDQMSQFGIFIPITHTTAGNCIRQGARRNTQQEDILDCGLLTSHRNWTEMVGLSPL